MIIELGHFSLSLALVVFLLQAVAGFTGAQYQKKSWMMLSRQSAFSSFWLVSIAFLGLLHAYALSDFSVLNVAKNSHTLKPITYKIAALWGNHEGSMLLWLWMLCFWTALFAKYARGVLLSFAARVTAVQGLLAAGIAIFILSASNPFLRLNPAAVEGLDLNPLLQDPMLAVHPPLLYAGYVGVSLAFSFAVAALLEGRADAGFARALRPFVSAAFAFLTVGIAVGSYWAYYELGWGGFWFWDPVENASLMPWLAGVALIHSLLALEKRGSFPLWVLFLALIAFSFSMLGTFLVRSGVLTSVHAFASDPTRGIFILALLVFYCGGGLLLFGLRAHKIKGQHDFVVLSRETSLLFNNVFFMAALVTVVMGTLYPVFLSALDLEGVAVGAPYYIATLVPMLIPFVLLMGVGTRVSWGRGLRAQILSLRVPLGIAFACAAGVSFFDLPKNGFVYMAVFVAAWIIAVSIYDLLTKRIRTLPLSYYGMTLGHIGFAFLVFGAMATTQWGAEKTLWMTQGTQTQIAGKTVLMVGAESGFGVNYNADRVILRVSTGAKDVFLMPEKRWYPVQGRLTSETDLDFSMAGVFYSVLGDQDEKNKARWVVRLYWHPFLLFIFIGADLMALGALLHIFSRRRLTEAV